MTRALLALLLIAVAPVVVQAQTMVAVDIHRAELAWQPPADGGPVTEYRVRCGSVPGVYTQNPPGIVDTSIPIAAAVPGPGTWYCSVVAANQFGAGPASNEVSFEAGNPPGAVRDLTIRVR